MGPLTPLLVAGAVGSGAFGAASLMDVFDVTGLRAAERDLASEANELQLLGAAMGLMNEQEMAERSRFERMTERSEQRQLAREQAEIQRDMMEHVEFLQSMAAMSSGVEPRFALNQATQGDRPIGAFTGLYQ